VEAKAPRPRARAGKIPLTGSYAVVNEEDALERGELSHVDAMKLAETLRRRGKTFRVMHVVGGRHHEVDRYPAR
jgi:hypothetical protein